MNLKYIILCILLVSIYSQNVKLDVVPGGRQGNHGQYIFGNSETSGIFMSHMAGFGNHPHNIQCIMEVSGLSGIYQDDQYSFNPNFIDYSFDDLVLQQNVKWIGDIYRGNYLRAPEFKTLLQTNVEITVQKIHLFNFLQEIINTKQSQDLEYLILGEGKDVYLAHVVQNVNDFSQVIQVEQNLQIDQILQGGSNNKIIFPGRESNQSSTRLQVGEQVEGFIKRTNYWVTVTVKQEFFLSKLLKSSLENDHIHQMEDMNEIMGIN